MYGIKKTSCNSMFNQGLTSVCSEAFSTGDPGSKAAAEAGVISEFIDPALLNTNLAALSSDGPGEFNGFLDRTFFFDFVTFDDGANRPYFISHVKYLS